jgi:hypothetical protein
MPGGSPRGCGRATRSPNRVTKCPFARMVETYTAEINLDCDVIAQIVGEGRRLSFAIHEDHLRAKPHVDSWN